MAVIEKLFHRRTPHGAQAIAAAPSDESPPPPVAEPAADVDGYAQADAETMQGDAALEHWSPECGTPVFSKGHHQP